MDEQTQVVEPRRRRSRAEAGQLVAEYEASGLSQVEFCRKQGLSLATLARYRKRQTQGSPAAGNRWVEVKGVRAAGIFSRRTRACGGRVAAQRPAGDRQDAAGLLAALEAEAEKDNEA